MKRSTIVVAVAAVLATLVAATAAFAGESNGKTLYRYVGQLKATSGSSVTVTVQNGNRPALRSLLGQSQEQTFATGEKTVFLKWTNGIPEGRRHRRARRRRLRDGERRRRARRVARRRSRERRRASSATTARR